MNTGKMTRGKLALILAAVLFVSATITTALVFTRIVPDAMEQMSWEHGEGDPTRLSGNWQEYHEDWTADAKEGETVVVDLEAVYVELVPSGEDEVKISFSGQAQPYRNGKLPEIGVKQIDGTIQVQRLNKPKSFFGGEFENLRGTLRIELPEAVALHLDVKLFSGSITLKDYRAQSFALDTSSGDISVQSATSAEDVYLGTFSGEIFVKDTVAAATCTLSTSSGKTKAEGLTAKALIVNGFSNDIAFKQLSVSGQASIESSSGDVELEDFQAGELLITGFSGPVELKSGTVTSNTTVNVSSGKVYMEEVTTDLCDVTSLSGNIELKKLAAHSLRTDAASAALKATLTTNADLHCVSFSGDISLEMPADYQFEAEVDSFSGKLDVQYPLLLRSNESSSNSLRGIVGDGDNTLTIETSSGDIKLRPLEQD